jgi:hypothetical protein
VRIEGEKGVFTILAIDTKRHLADLLREGTEHKVETGIPIALLRVISDVGQVGELKVPA